jgi:hypothetical protein
MNPYRSGLSSAGKTGIVVVLIIVVLVGAYLAPSLSTGFGAKSTSLQAGGSGQGVTLLTLFGAFSRLQMQDSVVLNGQGNGVIQQQSVSYLVLGKASLNSIQYTKVEFSQGGVGNRVIAWFNPQGGIDRVDVLGDRNYTGSGAYIVAQIYVSALSLVTAISNNSTLLSMLSKTSVNSTSVGPTQFDVATYSLAVPSPPYKTITVKYVTIPGTFERLAVYLYEKMTDGTETTVQITSLAK